MGVSHQPTSPKPNRCAGLKKLLVRLWRVKRTRRVGGYCNLYQTFSGDEACMSVQKFRPSARGNFTSVRPTPPSQTASYESMGVSCTEGGSFSFSHLLTHSRYRTLRHVRYVQSCIHMSNTWMASRYPGIQYCVSGPVGIHTGQQGC